MKSILLHLLLINFTSTLFAQTNIAGKIINATTKAPVPYVNIGIKGESLGTVSDNDGVFLLENAPLDQWVVFSSIGYEVFEIKGIDMIEDGVIELSPKEYEIDLVEVQATRFNGEEKIFGLRNKTRGLSIAYGSPQLGTEMGALIAIDKPTYIKSANFTLNHAKGDSLLLRLNIYQYQDKKIGENLLKENILIEEKQRKGTISIDMTPYNLVLENNVLFSLEWIRNYDELGNKGITFDSKKSRKLKGVYLRANNNTDFFRLPFKERLTPCFYFIGKQSE